MTTRSLDHRQPAIIKVAAWAFLVASTVVALFWARDILIPITLAMLLAFILNPVVNFLTRRHVNRTVAVLIVLSGVGLFLFGIGSLITVQSRAVLSDLPKYQKTITERIRAMKNSMNMQSAGLTEAVDNIRREVTAGDPDVATEVTAPPSTSLTSFWPTLFTSTLSALGTLALMLILAAYFLVQQEDIRKRLLRLVGSDNVTATTKAVDDGGRRISRFLFVQCLVNGGYGLTLGLILLALGVPYPMLWGVFGALIRYIPYVGPWAGALAPISLSVATSSGWTQPLLVAGAIIALELIMNNVLEPMLFGSSIGVSEVAFLIFAAFWAFLWGPLGLVLAAPLTVTLVVLGEHVPALSALHILLSKDIHVEPPALFYQRLIAKDVHEASRLLRESIMRVGLIRSADEMVLPALNRVVDAYRRGDIDDRELRQINERAMEVLQQHELMPMEEREQVILLPMDEDLDATVLTFVQSVLAGHGWQVESPSGDLLIAELALWLEEKPMTLLCVVGLCVEGTRAARHLCKRLSANSRHSLVVTRLGDPAGCRQHDENLEDVGVKHIVTNLSDLMALLEAWRPVVQQASKPAATSSPQ